MYVDAVAKTYASSSYSETVNKLDNIDIKEMFKKCCVE